MRISVILFIVFAFFTRYPTTFAQPAISVESSNIDFSNVNVETSLQESIMIRNSGNGISSSQNFVWKFSKLLYSGTVFGLGVTPDDCIWINASYNNLTSNNIVVLNPDGTTRTIITDLTVDSTTYTLTNEGQGRGLSVGPDGTVYHSTNKYIYAINFNQTYGTTMQGSLKIEPIVDMVITTAVADNLGNILVTSVSGPNIHGVMAYNSSGNSLGMKIVANTSNLPTVSRDLALSPDGKDLFIASIGVSPETGVGVSHWHSDNGTLGTYTFVKKIGNYGSTGQEEVHYDAQGRLWVSSFSSLSYPARFDCWDLNTMTIVDSIVSPVDINNFTEPAQLAIGGFITPRGFWLSNDGTKAYIGDFGRGVLEYEKVSIVVTPNSLAFGDVLIDSSKSQNITIQNLGTTDLEISEISISGDGFTLSEVITPITITAGGSRTIAVQFLPTIIGTYFGTVTLMSNVTGSPYTVQLVGRGLAPHIIISQDSLDFGDMRINYPMRNYISVRNGGNIDLEISEVSISGDGFTLENVTTPITVVAGGRRDIIVQFLPTETKNYTGTVILTHNASDLPSSIQLKGRGTNPIITIDGTSIDFGDVNVGNSLQRNVRIINISNEPIVIRSFDILPNVFKLPNNENNETMVTVQPDDSYDITVQFSPTAPIDYVGFIIILYNEDGSVISLIGKGIQTISVNEPEDIMGDGSNLLFQSNPNPVGSGYDATINYRLNKAGTINITLYDVLGREVAKLVDEYKPSGVHSVNFNTKNLSSGVYFYRLRAQGYDGLKKMVVIK